MKMINKKLDNINGSALETIEDISKEYFSKVTREDESTLNLRIKTKVLNSMSDLKVGVNAKESGGRTDILFKTQVTPNVWFWVTLAAVFLIGLLIDGGIIFENLIFVAVIGGIIYWFQKRKLDKDFELMLSELEFNNSSGSIGTKPD